MRRGTFVLALLCAATGCAVVRDDGVRRLPGGWRLIEKGDHQALYGPDGRLDRVLTGGARTGRATSVLFYGSDGAPFRAEIDTDGDGRIDLRQDVTGR
jgi:hypothetical protein